MYNYSDKKSSSFTPKSHYVKPHNVSYYVKKNGTFVSGYHRDGDGNTSINRATGYTASNPGQKALLKK